jgi:electron transfer flavoprotein alpha subunit
MTRIVAILPQDDPDTVDPYGVITAAATLGSVTVVLAGHAPSDAAAEIAFARGATEVLQLAHPDLVVPAQTDQLVVLLATLIEREPGWLDQPGVFLVPAGQTGEELAARLAARLGGVALGRCQSVALAGDEVVAQRASHGGRAALTLRASRFPCCLAIRCPDELEARAQPPEPVVDRLLDVALPSAGDVRQIVVEAGEVGLDGARIIVSGGRGMEGEAGFAQLRELAMLLGGALGGSLPTIDAGWVPVARQIGQSGHYVSPELYMAVAISGTPQHMAGIAVRSAIIAINRDPDAEIFRHASIGVVADWKELLPVLLAKLQAVGSN